MLFSDAAGPSGVSSNAPSVPAQPEPNQVPAAAAPSTSGPPPADKTLFRSPNVVCPPDSVVPRVPQPSAASLASLSSSLPNSSRAHPFPFTSMNQAIHSTSREPTAAQTSSVFSVPPPPYPGTKSRTTPPPAVSVSSPLLVNLLQNDAAKTVAVKVEPTDSACGGGSVVTPGETLFRVNSTVKSAACATVAGGFQNNSDAKTFVSSSPATPSPFHLHNKMTSPSPKGESRLYTILTVFTDQALKHIFLHFLYNITVS